jgi:hypothetical protein
MFVNQTAVNAGFDFRRRSRAARAPPAFKS